MGSGTTPDLCGRLVQAQNIYQNYRQMDSEFCYSQSNDFSPNQIYYFEYGTSKLIRSEKYTYDDTDTTKFVYKKSETDFDPTYFQPKEVRDYTSDGNIDLQRFRYVTDFSNLNSSLTGNALALYQMKINNEVSTPIEVLAWRKNAADSEPRVLGGKLTNYQVHTFDSRKYLLPDNISLLEIPSSPSVFQSNFTNADVVSGSIVKDSHYAMRIDFGNYDTYGQLLDYQLVGDSPTNFTYNTTFLDSVYHAYVISSTKNLGGTPELTTTFKYRLPLIGVKQLIAPNGVKNSFFYDTFGWLSSTQDHHGNILAEYEYYYGTTNKVTTKQYVLPTTGITNSFESIPYYTTTHTYFDGLGRPIQTVGQALSPQAKDIVLATQNYDAYGRLDSLLTIYPTENDNGAFVSNGLDLAQTFYKDIAPYTKTIYENSMLNRPRSQFGLGNAWHSTDKKIQTFDEIAGNDIRYYTADATGNITLSGTYANNSLYKRRVIDEQGNTQIEITDNQGKLIQKQQQVGGNYLTTYYINDDFGRTVAILQPKAYALNSSIAQNTSAWIGGVFFYQYDVRGRVIQSHVPNGGFTYSIYDKLDRPVLNQDAHQRNLNLWSFTKYDAISREILSGELTNANSRSTIQSQFNAQTTLSETFDSNKPEYFYYTNNSFPIGADSSKVMRVNYFDNYATWRSNNFLPLNTYYSNTKGLLTGTWKRYTENRKWLVEALYYDTKGRVMESAKQNLQNNVEHPFTFYRLQGGIDSYSRIFAPQYFGAGSITYVISNTYGKGERKNGYSVQIINSLNNLQSTIQYIYNEIGQLVTKKFEPNRNYEIATKGADYINRPPALDQPTTQDIANKAVIISDIFVADGTTETYIAEIDTTHSNGLVDALQTINYEYHIRGQQNCINCRNKLVRPDPKENDLFSMKLAFEDDKRYYDGNISYQTWKTPNIAKNQQYKHYYDGASRLIKSGYSGGVSGSNYSLDTVRYDRNGNILQLKRNTIDNLSYAYSGNQLLSVTDAGTSVGFNDGNTSGNDYGYWSNGALKFDKNKGIDSIIYHSYLKKVSRVKFTNGNWVNFYYDADGTLLKRKLSNGDVWMYRDNLIMKNDSVYQIIHDEGRFIFNKNTQKWVSEFEYRDIWGNLRVSFRDSSAAPVSGIYKPPVVVQSNDYDVFGYEINSLSGEKTNNWKYQKQERIDEFGLGIDLFKFRPSDYQIGRFWQIDPLAEKYVYNSPYALQENKFGKGIELEGKELAPFSPIFSSSGVLVRPMVAPRIIPNTVPLQPSSPVLLPATEEHHISPNALKGHPVVQEARQGGFKQDGKENKIEVEKFNKETGEGRHSNHPEYNKEMFRKLEEFKENNPNRTIDQSTKFVRGSVSDTRNLINSKPDIKINDLFKTNVTMPTDNTKVQIQLKKMDISPCQGDPNCT
ncbi:DUF6443 domain-containing protein [Emticicia agri]|uniref:DUF6443 domain-containing protein n=1 Tax=Emticicia agri TaxID=2492393 RepID=A0A4Q5LX64_9BACT|nr:DUF6443 domain-containing protein [Emticicia agri]RYU94334.1 hypothetical protein EWM59_17570 [Emticicia agri]